MIQPLDDSSIGARADLASIISRDGAWLNELARAQSAPLADSDSLGRFGPRDGLLALEDGGKPVYASSARLHIDDAGRLLDERGRAVIGWAMNAPRSHAPKPIQVPHVAEGRAIARYEVDESGLVVGIPRADGLPSAPIPLARIAVAVFPAPQRLGKIGDVLTNSRAAGQPAICPADAPNVGGLVRQPTDAPIAELKAQAREAYAASAQAELRLALSSTRDALVRVALDVVK